MASSVPAVSSFMVVTHGNPQQGDQSFTSPQNVILHQNVSASSSLLGKFLKGEPAVLGTIEIMIGVVILLFGIVTAFYPTSSSFSGIMFWGAGIYITAGSLTVRSYKNLNVCLVKASLGMNIISTLTAGLAIILHCLDIAFQYSYCEFYIYSSNVNSCYMVEEMYQSRAIGIAGVMLVLSVLEFIVSICVSAFACKATCSSGNVQVIYQMPLSFPTSHLGAPPVNTSGDIAHQVQPPCSTSYLPAPPLPTSEMHSFQSSVIPPVQHSSAKDLRVDRPEDLPPVYSNRQW